MKLVGWGIAAAAIAWVAYVNIYPQPSKQWAPPPAFLQAMEQAQAESDAAYAGPLGDEARRACKRITGVTVDPHTSKDLIQAGYSVDVAMKWVECVVNYMTPIDPKKTEEIDRRIGKKQ